MNNDSVNLSIHSEEDVLIITIDKIASSFIREYYEYNSYQDLPPNIHLPKFVISPSELVGHKHEYLTNIPSDTTNEKLISTIKDVELFLKQEYTKDVLILIRNPWKRFISAFIQDYVKTLFNNQFPAKNMFSMFLRNNLEYSKSYKEKMEIWKKYDYLFRDIEHENPEPVANIKPLIKIFLKEMLISYSNFADNLNEGHNASYHAPILRLITSMNPNSKIKILDISDDNLEGELRKYKFKSNWIDGNKFHTSNFYSKMVYDLINEEKELKDFEQTIKNRMSNEIDAYNILYNKRT